MKRKLLSLLLVALLLFSCSAYANTFIVTSNADSGPGTLREALQTAAFNGTTVYDTILFNLPGSTFADRTITIFGTLVLSSKVIVDGTSQPGTNFGVSDAKIILNRGVELCTGLFMSNEDNIGLYGIWFKNFDYIDNLTGDCHGYSIMMNHVKNIAVGKLNKGNAFSNQNINSIFHKNYFGIDYLNPIAFADTINIEYNYFGLDDAGLGLDNVNQEGISLWNGRNVIINHNYGNCYAAVGSASETGNGYIRFTNNNFSNPINSQIHGKGALAVTLQGLTAQFVTYDLTITGNKITNDNQYCIIIWDMHGSILIDNNVLGEFYDIQNEPDLNFGIGVIRCVTSYTGKITNNVIQNRKKGVWLVNCGKVFISKNSIFCTDKGIDIQNPIYNVPVVSLKNITSTSIEGQTSPGLKVELFYTDTCINLCENGKFYLGNTIADANGIFSFPYTGIGLISATTSTVDSITSEFNGVKVDTIHAVVKNATCGVNNGSITGIVILNASSWQWENELGQVISTIDTNLYNLSPGKYRLILQEANVSCPVITRFFEILSYPQPVLTGNP
ncbi:MAG TPA: hypothetical protein VI461_05010, partial [Chitinophagaceae bacterium]|nr:hypothetical protein [Chitinophagaceae bacterium]